MNEEQKKTATTIIIAIMETFKISLDDLKSREEKI